jgi:hypothetical protein
MTVEQVANNFPWWEQDPSPEEIEQHEREWADIWAYRDLTFEEYADVLKNREYNPKRE